VGEPKKGACVIGEFDSGEHVMGELDDFIKEISMLLLFIMELQLELSEASEASGKLGDPIHLLGGWIIQICLVIIALHSENQLQTWLASVYQVLVTSPLRNSNEKPNAHFVFK